MAPSQFPDQFAPYAMLGCDLTEAFRGTLFRFPLRTPKVAELSQIKKTAYPVPHVEALLRNFQQSMDQA